jgi:hypothetical protein
MYLYLQSPLHKHDPSLPLAKSTAQFSDRPPRFKRWKPLDLGDGSPPARQIQNSDLLPTEAAE